MSIGDLLTILTFLTLAAAAGCALILWRKVEDARGLLLLFLPGLVALREIVAIATTEGTPSNVERATALAISVLVLAATATVTYVFTLCRVEEVLLRQSEDRFRTLAEANLVAIAQASGDARLTYANPAFCQLLEVESFNDLRDRPLIDLYPEGLHDVFEREWDRRAKGMPASFETEIITKSNRRRRVIISSAPMMDAAGKLQSVIGTIVDTTELRKAEEALRHREAEITHLSRLSTVGAMVAGISHEISQPLYAVGNYATACRQAVAGENGVDYDDLDKWTRRISEEINRAGKIIRRLKDYSRQAPLKVAAVDVGTSIDAALEIVQPDAQRRQTELKVDVPENLPEVAADNIQLQQVLINLVRNACEASEGEAGSQPGVTIRACHDQDLVRLEVHDCGPGIDDEDKERIFEAFVTTKADGLGMGLPISRQIVEAHGGRLWAESTSAGSIFCFTLPVASEIADSDQESPNRVEPVGVAE